MLSNGPKQYTSTIYAYINVAIKPIVCPYMCNILLSQPYHRAASETFDISCMAHTTAGWAGLGWAGEQREHAAEKMWCGPISNILYIR